MKASLAAAFLMVFAFGPSCATALHLGEEGPLQKTVWRESGTPRFLPEKVLADPSTAGKGQPDLDTTVKRVLMELRRQGALYPDCAEPPTVDAGFGAEVAQTRSIKDLITAADTAVIGKVGHVVGGWGVPDHRVLSLVEVVVEGVLADQSFGPGDRITYIQNSGELRIGEERACSSDYPGFAAVRPGERILLIGATSGRDAAHINRHYVFPIRDGAVIPQPYPFVFKEPVSVDRLRGAIAP